MRYTCSVIPDSVPGSQKILVAIGDIQANSKGRNAHFLDIISFPGKVVEWSITPVLKTGRRKPREFESRPFRNIP